MENVIIFWAIVNLIVASGNTFIAIRNTKIARLNQLMAIENNKASENLKRDLRSFIGSNQEIISDLKKSINKPPFFQ